MLETLGSPSEARSKTGSNGDVQVEQGIRSTPVDQYMSLPDSQIIRSGEAVLLKLPALTTHLSGEFILRFESIGPV